MNIKSSYIYISDLVVTFHYASVFKYNYIAFGFAELFVGTLGLRVKTST